MAHCVRSHQLEQNITLNEVVKAMERMKNEARAEHRSHHSCELKSHGYGTRVDVSGRGILITRLLLV